MARSTGADLGAAIEAVVRAVALFPESEAPRSFPGAAAETRKHIAAILGARAK